MGNIATVKNFLSDFGALQAHQGLFTPLVNHDGAVYPAIARDIPREVKQDLYKAISAAVGYLITPKHTFLRRFEEGSSEPYQAHTDLNMANYTCIVYIQGEGGTAFVEHAETGMRDNDEQFAAEWERDTNVYDAWKIYHYEGLVPNKALMYDASLMHRGEPISGYGHGEGARELLICFYNPSILQRSQCEKDIMTVLKHPAIWENIGGTDGSFELPLAEKYHYLIGVGAVFILHPEGDDWMIHANVVPEARVRAFEMAQEALRYGFEVLGAKNIVASIPVEYENVYQFSLKSGMVEEGVVDGEHKMTLGYERWAL